MVEVPLVEDTAAMKKSCTRGNARLSGYQDRMLRVYRDDSGVAVVSVVK